MRDYLSTVIASLCGVAYIYIAAYFGYSNEALILLIVVGLPIAFAIRYYRFGRNTHGRRDEK